MFFQRRYWLLFLLVTCILRAQGQILPAEGSELNYRLVCFSFPGVNESDYVVDIASGYFSDKQAFARNLFKSQWARHKVLVAEVPAFGAEYTWRVRSKQKHDTSLHHFRTGLPAIADTHLFRVAITVPAKAYKDGFVFLDATKGLYDMTGKLVWYLPHAGDTIIRDLKSGGDGNITYVIDGHGVYDVDYFGDMLWHKGGEPGVKGNPGFHHEFTRLGNGHYMALGQEFVYRKKKADVVKGVALLPAIGEGAPDTSYERLPIGDLIEYNQQGEEVWTWHAWQHLTGSDIFDLQKDGAGAKLNPHENGFYFDEQKKCIYVSCRNISRIIKIGYPDGSVLASYSGYSRFDADAKGEKNLFCGQHACKLSKEGYIYLYDNNTCDTGQSPRLAMFREEGGHLRPIWDFDCQGQTDGLPGSFLSGGNIIELPDGSFFASMAYPGSSVFIVNRGREVLWCGRAETWNSQALRWTPINLYRASIIAERSELERLIIASEEIHRSALLPLKAK